MDTASPAKNEVVVHSATTPCLCVPRVRSEVSPHFEVFLVPSVPKKPPPPDRWCKEERDRCALLLQQEL